jgi:hypothetical protein
MADTVNIDWFVARISRMEESRCNRSTARDEDAHE